MSTRPHSVRDIDWSKNSDLEAVAEYPPTMAIQSQRDDADINVIVKRFGLTGVMPNIQKLPMNGDFSDVKDFRSALHQVIEAESTFQSVPADIRARFGNDPALFVDFCSDPKNLGELRKMGLAKPEPVAAAPMKVEVVNAPGGAPGAPVAPAQSST